jgi:Myb-like DNA-binding domain
MPHEWTKISEEFNERSGQNRTARQCREKWMNKIDPSITHVKFTLQEDILILQLYLENNMNAESKSRWHHLAEILNE